jgi:hypothetical protein
MLHTLYKVPYIFFHRNIDVMEMRLMVFKLQSMGKLKIVVVHGDLLSTLSGKSGHLHSCTAFPRFVVELRFLDLFLVLCSIIRVRLHGIGRGAFLGLITAVRQNELDAQLM